MFGGGGQLVTDDAPPGPHLAVWVRLPPCLCTPRPVASSDAHFPFLLGGDDTLFGGSGPIVWATLCRGGDGVADLLESRCQDILARFAPVVHNTHALGPANDFTNTHGPTSSWLR
jgi:hypothetical protein